MWGGSFKIKNKRMGFFFIMTQTEWSCECVFLFYFNEVGVKKLKVCGL